MGLLDNPFPPQSSPLSPKDNSGHNFNKSNESNIRKDLPEPLQESSVPENLNLKSEMSQRYIKGRGGLHEQFVADLRNNPGYLAELNKRLRSYKLPPVYSKDITKIAEEIIERRFSAAARSDNKITDSEEKSPFEGRSEWLKSKNLKKEEGTKAYNREKVMDGFFDYLQGKSK